MLFLANLDRIYGVCGRSIELKFLVNTSSSSRYRAGLCRASGGARDSHEQPAVYHIWRLVQSKPRECDASELPTEHRLYCSFQSKPRERDASDWSAQLCFEFLSHAATFTR